MGKLKDSLDNMPSGKEVLEKANKMLEKRALKEDFEDSEMLKNFLENGSDEEIIDDDDSDIIRMKVIKELAEKLSIEYIPKDLQVSRLTSRQIIHLTLMELTDGCLNFGLYNPFMQPFRAHQISLNGMGRKEFVDLVKSVSSNQEFMPESSNEGRGIFSRIRNRLFS